MTLCNGVRFHGRFPEPRCDLFGKSGAERPGEARLGRARCGKAGFGGTGFGVTRQARHGVAWSGWARQGRVWRGRAGRGGAVKASHGLARHDEARRGLAVKVRSGVARRVRVGSGAVGHGSQGKDRIGKARRGLARCDESRQARRGLARCGAVRRGMARCGDDGTAGEERLGAARPGQAGRGVARQAISKKENTMQDDEVKTELRALWDKHGKLTAELVVEAATDPDSPLHSHFEWDDSEASRHWRLQQAQQLLLASRIMTELREARSVDPRLITKVREWVCVSRGTGYEPRNVVLSDDGKRAELVKRRLKTLESWCAENVDVCEFDLLRTAIQREIDRILNDLQLVALPAE